MPEPVIIAREGAVGRITLNRPEALHALNLPMCEIILAALQNWRSDDDVALIMINHAEGTRGFCGGRRYQNARRERLWRWP